MLDLLVNNASLPDGRTGMSVAVQAGRGLCDPAGPHGLGHAGAAVGQGCVFDVQIEHLSAFSHKGCNKALR